MTEIILETARLFMPSANEYRNLSGSHNKVYCVSGNNEIVLRFSAKRYKTFTDVMGEVHFKNYLAANKVLLDAPIPDCNGNFVVEVDFFGELHYVTAFQMSRGLNFMEREPDGKDLYVAAGKEIGKIHALSRRYTPDTKYCRNQWNNSRHMSKIEEILRSKKPELMEAYYLFLKEMNKLPKKKDEFGLIHGDFFFANFLSLDSSAVVIDFDECEYSWYLYDVAVCMYYQLIGPEPLKVSLKCEEAKKLFSWLMKGYRTKNSINKIILKKMDLFFKLRDFVLLSTILDNDLTGKWQNDLVTSACDRIINDKPLVDVNFADEYMKFENGKILTQTL